MRLLMILFTLLIASVLGVMISKNPGFALFAYEDWTLEMPLWLAGILLLLTVVAAIFILWVFNILFFSSGRFHSFWSRRRVDHARSLTYKGLLKLAEGRFQKAEKYLIKSAPYSDTPLINYLSATKAAEEGGSPERRNDYLERARSTSADSDILIRLTKAEFQMKNGELAESIENLKK